MLENNKYIMHHYQNLLFLCSIKIFFNKARTLKTFVQKCTNITLPNTFLTVSLKLFIITLLSEINKCVHKLKA